MIRFCCAVVATVVLLAGAAFAQMPGSIGVFSDAAHTGCSFTDTGGPVYVYMAHVWTDGATAVRFKLEVSATGWIHLGDHWNFPLVIGTSVTGVSIAYQGCLAHPIYLGYATFLGSTAPPCTNFGTVPDPASSSGRIEAIDCNETKIFPSGSRGVVNRDGSCTCGVPVEQTTWGQIKAQYH